MAASPAPSPTPAPDPAADPAVPVIELRNVHKVYGSGEAGVRAIAGVNLRVARGELVAVMGASGSGKSTLMNILGCLDRPSTGQYLLDGVDAASLSRNRLARLRNQKIGFVFQSFNLLARTSALENVELPLLYTHVMVSLAERHRRARAALQKVGLGERMSHKPSELSGGQQQRVAIARALVNQPDLLLADEPTGNLDSRTGIEIMGLFQELNDAGITIVMVTHELDIAGYCKRIVVMRDGRVTSDRRNPERLLAATERARLDAEEQAADIGAEPPQP